MYFRELLPVRRLPPSDLAYSCRRAVCGKVWLGNVVDPEPVYPGPSL